MSGLRMRRGPLSKLLISVAAQDFAHQPSWHKLTHEQRLSFFEHGDTHSALTDLSQVGVSLAWWGLH